MADREMDLLEPDGYLQPRRYRIHYRCEVCGHEYSRITTKLDRKDPPCPVKACREVQEQALRERANANVAAMLEEQRPPAHIGDKPIVKAIDKTAEVVMEGYGMTNLQDNLRAGDTMAPKLPPAQQRAADGYFNGSEIQRRAGGGVTARLNAMAQRAAMGVRLGTPVNMPTVQAGRTGEKPLRFVRTEKLKS
jgi:hypothetical protein